MAIPEWVLREWGLGIVTLLLLILTVALVRYIYTHRIALTIEQKEARYAAIGLAFIFGGLAGRGFEQWVEKVASRSALPLLPGTGAPEIYVVVLGIVMFGAMLTLRAFYPWPFWATLIVISVVIPLTVVVLL